MSATPTQLGRWTVLAELGRGGMGVVLRARDPALGRDVALKRLTRSTGVARERFLREARAAGRLRHPNIVAVHELAEQDGHDLLVMELVDGEALDRTLQRDGPLPVRRAVEVARDVARALEHAHGLGVLHRDVKPGNVLVERGSGRAMLVDFGVARELDAATLTRTGVLVGTPCYMAPEQLGGASALDGRADVYSLGATLHELLTGSPPFEGDGLLELIGAVQGRAAAPPSSRRPEVDSRLDAICLGCLEKDPARRYASAGALAHDLERWLAGARAVGPRAKRERPSRSARGAIAALGLLVLAGALSAPVLRRRAPALDPAAFAARLAAAAPTGRPLAGTAAAVAALESDVALALGDRPERAPEWLRDARARVVALRGLVALAEGDVPGARAAAAQAGDGARHAQEVLALGPALLAVTPEPVDRGDAARALGRAIDAGLDHPELRVWRAALLLAAPDPSSADVARAAADLERAAAAGRPELATPSLRALALLRRGRLEEAASVEGASHAVAAEVAAARALHRLERGLIDEALAVAEGARWDELPGRARAAATALADEARRRATPAAGLNDALVLRAAKLLGLARRVDPGRAPPVELVRRLMGHVTAYERAVASVDLALDIAELAPDDPFVQRRAGGLEGMSRGPQRDRVEAALRRALAHAPADPELLVPLADCLLDQGEQDEAGRVLDAVEALGLEGRDAVSPGVLRARWLMGANRLEDAAALLAAIEQRWGGHPGLREYRMVVHDRLGDGPLAVSLAFGVLRQEAITPQRTFTRDRALEVLWRRRGEVTERRELRAAVEGQVAVAPELWGWQVRAAWLQLRDGDVPACAASLERARQHVDRCEHAERDALRRAVNEARPDDPAGLERLVERLDALRGAGFEP